MLQNKILKLSVMNIKKFNLTDLLFTITAILVIVDLWMIFIWVPTEINQGPIQRIFYIHVPVAWASMVSICIVAYSVPKVNTFFKIFRPFFSVL